MRGDEEGDELVVLALSRLCGMAVQPVPGLVSKTSKNDVGQMRWNRFASCHCAFKQKFCLSRGAEEWVQGSFDGSVW